MASTYSDLKIELIGTGEQSGTWGTTTNTNLGTALEEAIVGRATANFTTDADLTLTLTDTNATQVARHYILNVTSGVSLSTTRNLIVPTIDKPYIIENNTTGGQSIVVKTSGGSGVTVPNGRKVMVYANSTNVVAAQDHIPSLTLGSALPVASGGTGLTTTPTNGQIDIGNGTGFTRTTLTQGTGVTITNGTGSITIAATNNGTVTSVGGTGTVNGITLSGTVTSSGNLTLGGTLSGVNLTSQVTGILPTANGGTNNGFFTVSGPASSAKTYTFPNENMSVGYRAVPQSGSDKTTAYSLVTGDVGKLIGVGSGGSIEIPDATFAAGDVVAIFNNTSGPVTITCTITTAYIGGTDTDVASVTLATRGVASILFISGTVCVITGNVS